MINLELTTTEAYVLNTLLTTKITGKFDGPRGNVHDIANKLDKLGIGFGRMDTAVTPEGNLKLVSIHY